MTGTATLSTSFDLASLVVTWSSSPGIRSDLDVHASRLSFVDVAASAGARSFLTAVLAERREAASETPPILVVTATTREADDLVEALACLMPRDRVATFPSWETLPHERLSPRSDTVGRRLAVLRRLAHPDPDDLSYGPLSVVVAPVRAVLQPIARGLGDPRPLRQKRGATRTPHGQSRNATYRSPGPGHHRTRRRGGRGTPCGLDDLHADRRTMVAGR
jgi:transcription-repair coupling factor (superfamily II helicase)